MIGFQECHVMHRSWSYDCCFGVYSSSDITSGLRRSCILAAPKKYTVEGQGVEADGLRRGTIGAYRSSEERLWESLWGERLVLTESQ